MKKFGLIGYPIEHSKSPALFGAGYRGRPYTYDLIEGEDFEKSYERFLSDYDGINVTAPFKELSYAKADWHSRECERIGATNLLVKSPEGVRAHNSDYFGVLLSVLRSCVAPGTALPARPGTEQCREMLGDRLRTALVAGCGGAGKAAVTAALDLGLETVLMNRTEARAEEVAARMDSDALTVRPLGEFAHWFNRCDLVIYTLPSPIEALDIRVLRSEAQVSARGKLILEANYRDPSFSGETRTAIQDLYPGVEFIPGRLWHLYQAYSGYELFTGEAPDLEAMVIEEYK